jgi:polyphosphate kinase
VGHNGRIDRKVYDDKLAELHFELVKLQYWIKEAGHTRLNCIAHVLSSIHYKDATPPPLDLPKRRRRSGHYKRPPKLKQNFVPDVDL